MLPHYRLRTIGVQLSFAGRVEAEDEVALAFRIPNRLIENSGRPEDRVQPGQALAKLESQYAIATNRAMGDRQTFGVARERSRNRSPRR
jgi:multidrug efflux pump subunit AcrA (membrane-fusion protein)